MNGRQIALEVAKQFQADRADAGDSGEQPSADEAESAISWQDKLLSHRFGAVAPAVPRDHEVAARGSNRTLIWLSPLG